jgi:hypothetical protein
MKTLACKQLRGSCDAKLSAGSWDEMVQVMTKQFQATPQPEPWVPASMLHRVSRE